VLDETIFQKIDCPLCNNKGYKVLIPSRYPPDLTLNRFKEIYRSSSDTKLFDQLVVCTNCDLAYLNPRARGDLILEGYSEAVDHTFIKQNPLRIRTFKSTFRKVIEKLKITPNKNSRILDIGCAGGAFPKAAQELGFDVIGIEPSAWMCDFARNEYNLDIRQGSLLEQKFSPQSFDIITLWDVLEHVTHPSQILERVHTLLKKDGALILTFPNYNSFMAKLLKSNWPFLLNVHLFYFTPKTIRSQLQKTGFQVLTIKPYWQILELGYLAQRTTNYFPFFSFFEKALSRTKLDSLPFKYNMGQSLVIAKKVE